MGKKLKILVVIPAYNEVNNISSVVQRVIAAGYDYVVVNDGSTDSTLQVLIDNKFNYINLVNNLGIGGAVQVGHQYALAHGYDVDIQFDGDGQHDIYYVQSLIRQIELGSDLVIGSRYMKGQESSFQSSFMRRVGKTWISILIKLFAKVHITDPTSGFRATSSSLLRLYATDYPADYPEPESILLALKQGFKVSETPVEMHARNGGESSISPLKSVYYMIKVTLAIMIQGTERKR